MNTKVFIFSGEKLHGIELERIRQLLVQVVREVEVVISHGSLNFRVAGEVDSSSFWVVLKVQPRYLLLLSRTGEVFPVALDLSEADLGEVESLLVMQVRNSLNPVVRAGARVQKIEDLVKSAARSHKK